MIGNPPPPLFLKLLEKNLWGGGLADTRLHDYFFLGQKMKIKEDKVPDFSILGCRSHWNSICTYMIDSKPILEIFLFINSCNYNMHCNIFL